MQLRTLKLPISFNALIVNNLKKIADRRKSFFFSSFNLFIFQRFLSPLAIWRPTPTPGPSPPQFCP
jgi:hypothetical protein